MATKLFVGGLSWDTTDDSLKNFFASAGNVVSASVISDKFSGRSKGFGFVEMSSQDEAKEAIAKLNGQTLDGRTIAVNVARPQVSRSTDFRRPDRPPRRSFDRSRRSFSR
ncbi:RNA-binding protein [Candidatus Amesbacteria bacterium]|nr:RNA-binding protein [Candidatus Amesbacteria bacterium]MBI2587388.1 RNA-binding protein [Candidatus Amesbacteria bacterium]